MNSYSSPRVKFNPWARSAVKYTREPERTDPKFEPVRVRESPTDAVVTLIESSTGSEILGSERTVTGMPAELAKKLGITRSSVNAWEMGISVPSTQYLVELSNIFSVSTDYLLGQSQATITIEGLTEEDIIIVNSLINHLKLKNRT